MISESDLPTAAGAQGPRSDPQQLRPDDEIEQLRQQARETLLLGAQNGRLLEALTGRAIQQDCSLGHPATSKWSATDDEGQQGADDKLDILREQAREALLQAARSGSLLKHLLDCRRESFHEEGADVAESVGVPESESGASDDSSMVMVHPAQVLSIATPLDVDSGDEVEEHGPGSAPPDDIEYLKHEAREALLRGVLSGALSECLLRGRTTPCMESAGGSNDSNAARFETSAESDDASDSSSVVVVQSAQVMSIATPVHSDGEDVKEPDAPSDSEAVSDTGSVVMVEPASATAVQGDSSDEAEEHVVTPYQLDELRSLRQAAADALLQALESGTLTKAFEALAREQRASSRKQVSSMSSMVMVQPAECAAPSNAPETDAVLSASTPACNCSGLCGRVGNGMAKGSVGCVADRSWCKARAVARDGQMIAAEPFAPPPSLATWSASQAKFTSRLVIVVDKAVADASPLIHLARALLALGRQVTVVTQKSEFAKDFEDVDCGLVVCAAVCEEALHLLQPSAILYTIPARVPMKRYERKHGVPAVLVGYHQAEIDLEFPPRPSVRVRDDQDAAIAANVVDKFAADYLDNGLWKHLDGLRR